MSTTRRIRSTSLSAIYNRCRPVVKWLDILTAVIGFLAGIVELTNAIRDRASAEEVARQKAAEIEKQKALEDAQLKQETHDRLGSLETEYTAAHKDLNQVNELKGEFETYMRINSRSPVKESRLTRSGDVQ